MGNSDAGLWWLMVVSHGYSMHAHGHSILLLAVAMFCLSFISMLVYWAVPGGPAWGTLQRSSNGPASGIPGPRGWPVIGSLFAMKSLLAHIRLAELAIRHGATLLMAFSVGSTRVVLTCVPEIAREILFSSAFADRPIKQSARSLLFHRAVGFAPYGEYWRGLRRIAACHMFTPRRVAAHQGLRESEANQMVGAIFSTMANQGFVKPRLFLQHASLNNIMGTVFGRRYSWPSPFASQNSPNDTNKKEEVYQVQAMVKEGFDLLGTFDWSDHLPFLRPFDFQGLHQRSSMLVNEVRAFVGGIIEEHRRKRISTSLTESTHSVDYCSQNESTDFVDALLSLTGDEKLSDEDMIAVLWEMLFRGTDTTAILTEWIVTEVILHPDVQSRLQEELSHVVGECRFVTESDIPQLPYMQAVVKETLRMHPPGPLLSWARLATREVHVAGHVIPAGTTAMVNMHAITHDPRIWTNPHEFKPERFLLDHADVDIRGNDLRLAPFGAGRRVCPGKALGLITVHLWVARLFHHFHWSPDPHQPVDLSEVLKLSCEMKTPLSAIANPRIPLQFSPSTY